MNVVAMNPLAAAQSVRAGVAAPADHAADAVVRTLRDLDAALAPVIGPRGVAALCKRSLHVAARHYPWLGDVQDDGADATIDFQRLTHVLASQCSEDAGAAGAAVLQAFHDLLASLVGAPLTRQLLGGVGSEIAGEPRAQVGPTPCPAE